MCWKVRFNSDIPVSIKLINFDDENFPWLKRLAAWTTGLLSVNAMVLKFDDKIQDLKYGHLAATYIAVASPSHGRSFYWVFSSLQLILTTTRKLLSTKAHNVAHIPVLQ